MTTPPPSDSGRWSDLYTRVLSGAVMVVVGLWAVWMGQDVFHVFVALVCGAMVWELVLMLSPATRQIALQLGAWAGAAVLLAIYRPAIFALPVLIAPALVGFGQLKQNRMIYLVFTALVLLAGYGMMSVRDDLGFIWMLWLVLVVVITDIAGYFAGRMIGGPKFWPSISPKKTWSGTSAGCSAPTPFNAWPPWGIWPELRRLWTGSSFSGISWSGRLDLSSGAGRRPFCSAWRRRSRLAKRP